MDFVQQTYNSKIIGIKLLPITIQPTPEVSLTLPKPTIEGEMYFFALALEFFLDVNDTRYDPNDVSRNPTVILAVS